MVVVNRRSFLAFCTLLPLLRRSPPVQRLVAFGDSITVGDGATEHRYGYAQLVAGSGLLDNRAVSGTRMIDHEQAIRSATFEPSDTVLWLTGYNDMRIGTPLEEYRAGLQSALSCIPGAYIGNCLRMPQASYSIPPNDKGSDARVLEFNRVIAQEVRAAGCHLVDACAAWDTALCDDRIHPNNEGHAALARAFLATMRRRVYLPFK